MTQFFAASATTSGPIPFDPNQSYWPLSNPKAGAAIENLIDLSSRDFRDSLKWPYKVPNRVQNKDFIDNIKLCACELLKHMPFSNQTVTVGEKNRNSL